MNKVERCRRRLNVKIGALLAVTVLGLGIMIGTYVTQAARTYLTDDVIALIYVWTLVCLYLICSLVLPSINRVSR